MPKQDEPAGLNLDDDEDATVDVTIEGDAVAAEMARQQIEKIVDERTSNVSLKMKDVPAEYYPFLRGPHDAGINALENAGDIRVQIPRYHTWRDQAPPQPAVQGQPAPYIPQPGLPIQIQGDRHASQQAQEQIRRQVEALRRQLTHHTEDTIERGRHQFIMGEQGEALHDILKETGCAVIFPPPGEDSDTLYIVGPPEKLQEGIDKVMELAAAMSSANVDIARQYQKAPNAQEHARNLAKYLRQRQAIADLERRHNAKIVLPPTESPSNPWEVYAKDGKNVMRARAEMVDFAKAHPPDRIHPMDVDPFFHQYLQEREASKIRRDHGVHLVFPEGSDSNEVLLVSEEPGSPSNYQFPRQQPTPQEIQAHKEAIQVARKYLQDLIDAHDRIVEREIEAPPKFNDKIRRYAEKEQLSLPERQIPVELLFGPPVGRPSIERSPSGGFSIRGPSNHVDDLQAKLLAFIEQAKKDELERSYTTTFDFPQKFANFLIGKRGENIKKLRDEFDVEIQVKDGKVEIQGPQAKAHACKNHILSDLKKWEDETTHVLIVEPEFHRDLIGPKGSQVRRLEDRYNVRINFPRSAGDDNATEGSVKNFNNQPANHVVVKGPSKGADAAREELKGLMEYLQKTNNVATVSIAQSQVPSIIGRNGAALDELRIKTKCQIDVPHKDEADAHGRIAIRIKGEKHNVAEAKKLLEAASKQFDDTITKTIDVPKKHHQSIIGPKGKRHLYLIDGMLVS
jgi:transcription antitermination factor NusA-like protein/rRNA processing protein Krr1/Pno1